MPRQPLKFILFCCYLTAGFMSLPAAEGMIQETTITPGIIHRHIRDETQPWSIHVLEIDLTLPGVDITAMKARDQLQGNEKTSEQAQRFQRDGVRVIAAINADFYGLNGIPISTQVLDGVPLKSPSEHVVFGMTYQRQLFIERLTLDAKISFKNGATLPIDGINRARLSDEMIFYNAFWGAQTGTNLWGSEVTLQFLEPFVVGDTIQCLVTHKIREQGNQLIPPKNGGVISAHGRNERLLYRWAGLQEPAALWMQFAPLNTPLKVVVGGMPRLIRDGNLSIELQAEGIPASFATTRHPRTAIGYHQSGQRLFLVTVDGRQPAHSVGMTLDELARFLLSLGCYQALNLDGGGSTTMVIANKVVNSPSDATGERAVANSLLILAPTTTGRSETKP
ncbi:phosphodiester glycosidase family protein [candidate division KSB1 bacterium]|nr:phosphodiester glycosidase family protein [candidate division KSB1 bacterium]